MQLFEFNISSSSFLTAMNDDDDDGGNYLVQRWGLLDAAI